MDWWIIGFVDPSSLRSSLLRTEVYGGQDGGRGTTCIPATELQGQEGPFHFFCVYVGKRVNGEENDAKMTVKCPVLLGILRILGLGSGV